MTHRCPRRDEMSSVFKLPSGEDTYRADNTCSYCGSLNPDEFMARVEAGDVELGPTDKDYKVYVANRGGKAFSQTYRDCPLAKVEIVNGQRVTTECAGPDTCTHWVTREIDQTKFYWYHLSEDQMRRFVDLMNQKNINIGCPGHFYTMPYFIK